MSLVIQPVSPHIGAEVIGADLSQPVGDNLFRELHQAWVDADGLLVVRDQQITPEQQITFSRRFGELASAGDNPVIQKYALPGYP
ncbi:MAG: TauD/TfdA family dioxygenase, partial [Alphaproteobacteria bacterium]